jgi:hypothetical protein
LYFVGPGHERQSPVPLRHAVWTAANSRFLFPRNPRIMPGFFGDFPSLKWTAENGLLGIKGLSIPAFLRTPQRQSGFADMLGERNAIKIDHVAKPT